MRLPRMTTRRWMIVVAVVGLAMGVAIGDYRLKRRHDDFSSWTQWHLERAADWREREQSGLTKIHALKVRIDQVEQERDESPHDHIERLREILTRHQELTAAERRRASYHDALARKYERAASYPWLPVEPDPPEPQ